MNVVDYLKRSDELVGEEVAPYSLEVEASPMHMAVVSMLREMLEMMEGFAAASGKVPAPLRAMGRTIKHLEPMLLEGFIDVPESEIEAFLSGLVERVGQVIDEAHAKRDALPSPAA